MLNKQILEAIQRGISLAIDDFDDVQDIDNQKIGKVKNSATTQDILKFNELTKDLEDNECIPISRIKEIASISKRSGLKYDKFNNKSLKAFINNLFSYNREEIVLDNFANIVVDLNWIDTSNITTMRRLFAQKYGNVDVSQWNVSHVVDMSQMFQYYYGFDCDLSKWDVHNVIDMSYMFSCCNKFNSNISNWDIHNVTNITSMFNSCKKFDQDLSKWDASNIKLWEHAFSDCKSLKRTPSWYVDLVENEK